MVNYIQLMAAAKAEGIARPFPVAFMPHHDDQALIGSGKTFKEFRSRGVHTAMLQHGGPADGQRFKGFEKKVAEITVKAFADGVEFGIAFFGKRIPQVLKDHFFTVAYYVVQEQEKYIR